LYSAQEAYDLAWRVRCESVGKPGFGHPDESVNIRCQLRSIGTRRFSVKYVRSGLAFIGSQRRDINERLYTFISNT